MIVNLSVENFDELDLLQMVVQDESNRLKKLNHGMDDEMTLSLDSIASQLNEEYLRLEKNEWDNEEE